MAKRKSPKNPKKIASKTKELPAPFDLIQEKWSIIFPGLKLVMEEDKRGTVVGWELGRVQARMIIENKVMKEAPGDIIRIIEQQFKDTAIKYFLEHGGR